MNRDLRFAPTFGLPPGWFAEPAPVLRRIIPHSCRKSKFLSGKICGGDSGKWGYFLVDGWQGGAG